MITLKFSKLCPGDHFCIVNSSQGVFLKTSGSYSRNIESGENLCHTEPMTKDLLLFPVIVTKVDFMIVEEWTEAAMSVAGSESPRNRA